MKESGVSCYETYTGLGLWSFCLSLLSMGITDMNHRVQTLNFEIIPRRKLMPLACHLLDPPISSLLILGHVLIGMSILLFSAMEDLNKKIRNVDFSGLSLSLGL